MRLTSAVGAIVASIIGDVGGAVVRVDPAVGARPDGIGDEEIEASIPVDNEANVQDQHDNPEDIGPVGPAFRPVKELDHSVQTQHPIEPDNGVGGTNGGNEVQPVQRDHRNNVQFKRVRTDVLERHLARVDNKQSLLQIRFTGKENKKESNE